MYKSDYVYGDTARLYLKILNKKTLKDIIATYPLPSLGCVFCRMLTVEALNPLARKRLLVRQGLSGYLARFVGGLRGFLKEWQDMAQFYIDCITSCLL